MQKHFGASADFPAQIERIDTSARHAFITYLLSIGAVNNTMGKCWLKTSKQTVTDANRKLVQSGDGVTYPLANVFPFYS